MMKLYREKNGDFLAVDEQSATHHPRGYLTAVSTAISGLPTSICWGDVSRSFLAECRRVRRKTVERDGRWQVLLYRMDWYNEESAAGHYPPALPYPPVG